MARVTRSRAAAREAQAMKIRRDILAAQLRVALDNERGRETPEAVVRLSKLPFLRSTFPCRKSLSSSIAPWRPTDVAAQRIQGKESPSGDPEGLLSLRDLWWFRTGTHVCMFPLRQAQNPTARVQTPTERA